MKKIYTLALLLTVTIAANAQKSVLFKFKYKPKQTYDMSLKSDMNMEMTMSGDSATMAGMAKAGMKQPIVMTMNSESAIKVKTDAANADKSVPFTMTLNTVSSKMTMNGVEKPSPANPINGKAITGKCDPDGKMNIDSIGTAGMPEQLKDIMRKAITQSQAQIKFPDRPLAVGESFTQNIPMEIPAAGMNLKCDINSTYKLIAIKGDLAYFDVMSNFDMDINVQNSDTPVTGKGHGSGPGNVVFSISKNYPLSVSTDMDMNFDMNVKVMKLAMKIKAKSAINNTITAN